MNNVNEIMVSFQLPVLTPYFLNNLKYLKDSGINNGMPIFVIESKNK